VKLRNERPPRTERRKTVSSAVPILAGGSSGPAVDLMSRRHPLSSTRALRDKVAFADLSPEDPRDAPASRTPAPSQGESYFFALRVFFAVFFTALFAFAFFAFLAMLPS
jgi:hypothetical protein